MNKLSGYFFCNQEIGADGVPDEIDVLSEGTYKAYVGPDGVSREFTITAAHIDACLANLQERKQLNPSRDIVIDYEHQTLKGGEAPAAGWMQDFSTIMRDGKKVLRAKLRTWTDKAKQYIANKEYRYISPVFALNAVDKKSGNKVACLLYNAALTNEPFFDELQPIISSVQFQSITFHGKDNNMDELLERLRYFLGLPITATAENIMSELKVLIGQIAEQTAGAADTVTGSTLLVELKALQSALTAKNELLTALGLNTDASVEEAKGVIVAAKGNASTLQSVTLELNAVKKTLLDEKFDLVIAKGIETGRILPAQKADAEWLSTQRGWAEKNFKSFLGYYTAKAPVVGPLTSVPDGAGSHEANDATVVARAAQDYVAVEAKSGRHVSYTEAVNHIIKRGAN